MSRKEIRGNLLVAMDACRKKMEELPSLDPALKLILESLLMLVGLLTQEGGANPDNSPQAPSKSIGYRAKPKPKTGRASGGQEGHPGQTLTPVGEQDVDDRVPLYLKPEQVPAGYHLTDDYEVRQVFDIHVRRHVTEYRAYIYRDADGREITTPFPPDVLRKAQYGCATRSHAVYLSIWQLLPYRRMQSYFSDAGLSLSEGSIYHFNALAHALLDDYERWARWELVHAVLAHYDETGIRVAREGWWLHSASTDWVTLFMPHPKRGREAMDAMGILPRFQGIAVHDFWKPYLSYDARHVFCGAHLLRDLEGVSEKEQHQWAADMR